MSDLGNLKKLVPSEKLKESEKTAEYISSNIISGMDNVQKRATELENNLDTRGNALQVDNDLANVIESLRAQIIHAKRALEASIKLRKIMNTWATEGQRILH